MALWWAIAGAAALGVEIFVLDLTFALIAAGAFAGAVTAFAGGPIWAQATAAVVVAGVGLLFLRPVALRHLRRGARSLPAGAEAVVGLTGRSTTEVTVNDGRVQLRGEMWSARLDPTITTIAIAAGTPVVVTRVDGATALVHPIDEEISWNS